MKGFVNLTHTNNKKINDVANRVSVIENTYAKKGDISNVYKYKGSVANYSDLPTLNNAVGDTYNVVNSYLTYPAGTNFAWDGTKFDALGGAIDFNNAEFSAILSLDSDQMDNYLADGGLTNGQLVVCKKVITNGYIEGGVYRFDIQYPNTYSWVEIGATKLVSDINTILEDIAGV